MSAFLAKRLVGIVSASVTALLLGFLSLGEPSVKAQTACTLSPDAPSGLAVVVAGASVTVTWRAPTTGCSPTQYVIEAGSAPGLSNLAAFSTGSAATTFAASAVPSGTYYVRVRSTALAGTSAPSNEATFSIVGAVPCSGAPSVPAGVISTVHGNAVVISWTASSGAVLSYMIEAGSASGLANLAVIDTGSSSTSLTASAPFGTYHVRVRARNNCGTSAASSEITVIVADGGHGPAPDNVTILVSDLVGQRIVSVSDMNGANWQTGPTVGGHGFVNPWHVTFDSQGRIYVADRDNSRIVRMDDIAGNGWTTFDLAGRYPIPACDAGQPVGCIISIAVDRAGRIYFTAAGRIGRIDDMTGAGFTTFGIGSGAVGSFINPKVVAFDPQGRIYVTDTDRHRIDRFDDMQGTGWVTFGSHGSGVGQFDRPEGLAVDALGRIYVTDNENSRIVRIDDMTGAGWVTFGSYGSAWTTDPDPLPAVGHFFVPHDIAVSASMKIYVLDTGNQRVVRIDDMTGAGWTTFGRASRQPPPPSPPTPPGVFEFIAPKGIALAPKR
jgi:predicted nicotinamide N-methyase